MRQVEAFEEIDAPPDVVWEVLLEFDSYPEWNPFVRSIEGIPVEGEHLRIRMEPPESRGMTFRPEVLVAEENRRLAWLCRLLVPFAFDAYHEFRLEPIDGGERTRLLQRETFRGALVPALLDEERVERGFRRMNAAVRERAERRIGVPA
ncbi:SRPBCC domain-containing protein [Natronobeatus ordinarius]|uniref:SRPBCC domain-containing protein n=1 Tax=Natronobeatus ordinarius TaxID=2963433 RepID=UPI0020CF19A5|nr:SRPBCC domain-containing protein [Natronobeatus ordinarius]